MADSGANVLEIPPGDIAMQDKPFAIGGFGEVYKAKWRHKNVVVKVIRMKEEEKQEILQEANLTFFLRHPNIIDLMGVTYVKSWQIGIVMEEAKHGSLDQWIGKIDQEQLTKIALGITDGLKYVHLYKVIHRDIKPMNILMFGRKAGMIPKLADFGSAKIIQRVTKNTKVGDFIHMAPEVAQHCQYGFPADIFSLAMMLFEMFNEQLITEATAEVQRFVSDVHAGKIVKIPKSCKVPPYLRNIIERGLNKKPEDRPTLTEYQATLHGKIVFVSACNKTHSFFGKGVRYKNGRYYLTPSLLAGVGGMAVPDVL